LPIAVSEKLWLPPTKFGEGIDPLRPPPKVRIKGVEEHSDLAQRIIGDHAGRIGQFHMAQAHNYSLAPQQIYRGYKVYPEMRLRYTNIAGQEIIDIEINPKIIEQIKLEPWIPWDWTIVNFKVIDPPGAASFAAFLRVPLLSGTIYDGSLPKGVTAGSKGEKPISFPDPANPEFTEVAGVAVDDGYTAASLRNDLRVVGPESGVIVDVYGKIEGARMCLLQPMRFPITFTIDFPANEPQPDPSFGTPVLDTVLWNLFGNITVRRPDCTTVGLDLYIASNNNNFGGPNIPARLTDSRTVASAEGDTVVTLTGVRVGTVLTVTIDADTDLLTFVGEWNSFSGRDGGDNPPRTQLGWWMYTISGEEGVNSWNIGSFDADIDIAISNPAQSGPPAVLEASSWDYGATVPRVQLNYHRWFTAYIEETPEPGESDAEVLTCDMVVAGIIGRGDPAWIYSEHSNDQSFDAWELEGVYPEPVPTGILANTTISTAFTPEDTSVTNHFGLPYLGTIVADRRWGALTFNPAED
jgi:hypothetical protein